MPKDIVDRLREGIEVLCEDSPRTAALLDDAAKEIEKLRRWNGTAADDLDTAVDRINRLRRERDESLAKLLRAERRIAVLGRSVEVLIGRLKTIAIAVESYL